MPNKNCIYRKGDLIRCVVKNNWNLYENGEYKVIFSRYLPTGEYVFIETKRYITELFGVTRVHKDCDYYPITFFKPVNPNLERRNKLLALKKRK